MDHVYEQIEKAVDFVLRNIRLGATIEGLVRKEKYELPPEAIREMIVNAHCHRNFLYESCIQVAVYDDRLEVTSPGGLYNGLTYEELMSGHSRIRNKGIANVFSQMGLVESWGSGIRRILDAAKDYDLAEPVFQEFDNMFRVELFRNSMHYETMNIANGDNAGDIRGDNTGGKEDISNIVIELMKETPSITAVKLSEKTNVSTRQISRVVKALRESGRIVRVGSTRSGYWKIIDNNKGN